MHLTVPGAIGKFYSMQVALTRDRASNRTTSYLLARLQHDVHFWRCLYEAMDTHPTYLADIVHRYASDLGYCNASGV